MGKTTEELVTEINMVMESKGYNPLPIALFDDVVGMIDNYINDLMMIKKLTNKDIKELSETVDCEPAVLKAVILVEGSGSGFDKKTGKIKIQFEPHWFLKYTGISIPNKVDIQKNEWRAFNKAWKIDPIAAMKSTSWGIMQVMGFNHNGVGFNEVGKMVDYAKLGEKEQVDLGLRYISSIPRLLKAMRKKDWSTFAYYYNGPSYRDFNYDERLERAYYSVLDDK